jgi:hypothetical protein
VPWKLCSSNGIRVMQQLYLECRYAQYRLVEVIVTSTRMFVVMECVIIFISGTFSQFARVRLVPPFVPIMSNLS